MELRSPGSERPRRQRSLQMLPHLFSRRWCWQSRRDERTGSLPSVTPCHRSFPIAERKGEQPPKAPGQPPPPFPGPPPAGQWEPAEPRARPEPSCSQGAAEAAGPPRLSGGRGLERSPWDRDGPRGAGTPQPPGL
ncbi:Krueppel-like factor 13 [Chiroxiphia lanceolata]|uniref:Krueppel-like factor 13 n=1 Tax=Chiroxiphia lanceolata TaxID=296741 RepID=UPI0013CF3BA9|nr:Krueppel-like factor 13 [Chiroxiphia lanceolata]